MGFREIRHRSRSRRNQPRRNQSCRNQSCRNQSQRNRLRRNQLCRNRRQLAGGRFKNRLPQNCNSRWYPPPNSNTHLLPWLPTGRAAKRAMSSAELPQWGAIAWENGVETADSIARPMEHKLDLREVSRTTPRIALDLRIVPPESLETESRPLAIPVALALPGEASVWIGPHRDFAGELVSLHDFAEAQFSKSDFGAPTFAGSSAASAVPEQLLPEPQPAENEPPPETDANSAESQTAAPTPSAWVPGPELDPLPVSSTGIAPGKAKPLPVFGPAPVSAGTVQIPQPNGLPLRPVMVLAAAVLTTAVKTSVHDRKRDFLGLRSALSIRPLRRCRFPRS